MPQSSKASSLGEFLQINRIPIALISVGTAWLLASSTGLAERVAENEHVRTARRRIGEMAGQIGAGGASEPQRTGQILGPNGEPALRAGDTSGSNGWVHQAAGVARGAISSVHDAGNAVLDRATTGITSYASDAGDLAKRAGGQLADKLERDPWLIGVVGFVAGALLAAMLPPTRAEQHLLGKAQDELRSKASKLGHEAAERLRDLAESTTRT